MATALSFGKSESIDTKENQQDYFYMIKFLRFLNEKSNKFFVRGSIALVLQCLHKKHMGRIDLDNYGGDIFDIVREFVDCTRASGYDISYRCIENKDTNKCVLINYGDKTFSVNVVDKTSYVSKNNYDFCNYIRVYNLPYLTKRELDELAQEINVNSLYVISYLYNNFIGHFTSYYFERLIDVLMEINIDELHNIAKNSLDNSEQFLKYFMIMYNNLITD